MQSMSVQIQVRRLFTYFTCTQTEVAIATTTFTYSVTYTRRWVCFLNRNLLSVHVVVFKAMLDSPEQHMHIPIHFEITPSQLYTHAHLLINNVKYEDSNQVYCTRTPTCTCTCTRVPTSVTCTCMCVMCMCTLYAGNGTWHCVQGRVVLQVWTTHYNEVTNS